MTASAGYDPQAPAMKSAVPDADLLAALGLDDKVRLLTGADNWSTCPLPAIGLRSRRTAAWE